MNTQDRGMAGGRQGGIQDSFIVNYPREKFRDENTSEDPQANMWQHDRYAGVPLVMIRRADGTVEPAPFLMSQTDVIDLFRLAESTTRFPEKTIQRYRRRGLKSIRIGRRVWFRLDDVLRFLDKQQCNVN